jgi:cobalt-zinc-cadmium efflux system protein
MRPLHFFDTIYKRRLIMSSASARKLSITFFITIGIFLAELTGGLISNSLALLSDAGHVFTDSFALGLSMVAARISLRPIDRRATFGYHRVGLLAAVINGISLVGIAAFIFFESYKRFVSPPDINLAIMMPIAAAGFIANLVMVFILGGHGHEDLNVRSAWLHVLGDTLASVGVLASGTVLYFTGWRYADPVAGVIIGLIIITGGARVVKEAVYIFLDLAPRGYDIGVIADKLREIPEVQGVHDLHIRSLTHRKVSFTAHIWIEDMMLSDVEAVRHRIHHVLHDMGIHHITLQFEAAECPTNGLFCQTCAKPAGEPGHHHHHHH